MTILARFVLILSMLASATALSAQSLPPPEGAVILTVTGPVTQANSDAGATFDLAMLDALEQRVTRTETPWHEGMQEFTGPRLADIMAAAGATGSGLRIIAINDYAATMPWEDVATTDVILATRQNGALMPVREKGPLFVIYPFGENPALSNEVYFSRSVWQVNAIEVLP